ncbi:MAG: pyrroloquinoline quinone biosynthesis protein PqqF [Pseudomonas sp.]
MLGCQVRRYDIMHSASALSSPPLHLPRLRQLASGCVISAVQQPGAGKACLIVEVQAGSHDEPAEWPGLAHFLEHLLFLGGERYLGEQRLLPYGQACSARINASTGARRTQYHCEVPAALLEPAGLRLLDMLSSPRLAVDDQVRECNVLQAEFQARAADSQQQSLCALLSAVAEGHPCHAFVAGNSASLQPQSEAFRLALRTYHQHFYHAANCRLMLVGPQPASELLALGERLAVSLAECSTAAVAALPAPLLPLRASHWCLQQDGAAGRLWLGLVWQTQETALAPALQLLGEHLACELPGGFLHGLRQAGLVEELRVHVPYQHAGQAILGLELTLSGVSSAACAMVRSALLDWLQHAAEASFWSEALAARACELPWRLAGLSPLELGFFWLNEGDADPSTAPGTTLQRLLHGFSGAQLVSVLSQASPGMPTVRACGFDLALAPADLPTLARSWSWPTRLRNPLLEPLPEYSPGELPEACHRVVVTREQGALLMRWEFPAELTAGQIQSWRGALSEARGAGRRLGVQISGQAIGRNWQLQVQGPAPLLPQATRMVLLGLLRAGHMEPKQAEPLHPMAGSQAASEMPIRRLLQWLPDVLAGGGSRLVLPDHCALAEPWRLARWHGVLVGPEKLLVPMAGALREMPGQGGNAARAPALAAGRHWHYLDNTASDAALLLYCPLPGAEVVVAACWRFLGLYLAPAFYQRLRVELQLGYGLFSGFHEVDGQGGLLFAVQSSTADPQALLAHIECFLAAQAERLSTLSPGQLREQASALAQRLLAQNLNTAELAALHWQQRMAGHGPERVADLRAALEGLSHQALIDALQQLRQAAAGWLLLACKPS